MAISIHIYFDFLVAGVSHSRGPWGGAEEAAADPAASSKIMPFS
jgi:hypothetical protein